MIDALPLLLSDEGYQISRSVRLRSSASAYLNRTLTTPTDAKKWTWSAWVKRGILGASPNLFWAWSGSGNEDQLMFSTDTLRFYVNGGVTGNIITNAVFRDPSAWYHIVAVYDSANATSNDRMILYVNGTRQTLSTNTQPTLNYSNQFNTAVSHSLGRNVPAGTYFDGYMTEVNFIDGQALTPSSFGQTNTVTGVWQPKKYTGTYGTNGFYLNFSDNSAATAAAIGKDYSGNGNNWTPNNISVTAGVTYDSMLDVPTQWADGGNGRGNYCTLNPLTSTNSITVNNGNLYSAASSASGNVIRSTLMNNIGKWYFEATVTFSSIGFAAIGVVLDSQSIVSPTGLASVPAGMWLWRNDAYKVNNGTATAYGTSASSGDIIMIAYDAGAGKIWFGRQGTWFASGDPAAGTNESFSGLTTSIGACVNFQGTIGSSTFDCNFGQRPFTYTPPTGFKALNTQNLPDSTIKKGNQYFDVSLWTGDAATPRAVVSNLAFSPDLVWTKDRSVGYQHSLQDTVRGTGASKKLYSSLTEAENGANSVYGHVNSFDANGFTVATGSSGAQHVNASGVTYVGWQWKEGATQGFDIVTFTGNGSVMNIAHSLGVAPAMMITKSRSSVGGWPVYHKSIGGTGAVQLESTGATNTNIGYWNNTAPTSSVFTISPTSFPNGTSCVAYLFAEVAGFSKFGSYTGNGSADGPFVFCGFRPRFILIKESTPNARGWRIFDTARSPSNQAGLTLSPNTSDAEDNGSGLYNQMDILSNGFKLRAGTNSEPTNESSATYIFAAFAENPFKNALAR